jgi:hypothetical protein
VTRLAAHTVRVKAGCPSRGDDQIDRMFHLTRPRAAGKLFIERREPVYLVNHVYDIVVGGRRLSDVRHSHIVPRAAFAATATFARLQMRKDALGKGDRDEEHGHS